MIDIFSLKVEELSAKIKDSQLTSVEICKKYIERINKFEKDVKAWAHFNKKLLMEKLLKLTIIEDLENQQALCMEYQ